jgi:hypothetical protein
MAPHILLLPRAPRAARLMAEAAVALLASLDAEQRGLACAPFEGEERYRWAYTPGPRAGLPLKAMTAAQRDAALQLFDAGLSVRGAATGRQIIAHEAILRETERIEQILSGEDRDPELYYFTVFGAPGGPAPWGWRANGHHLALHFTVVGGELVSATPLFFGANPATVHHGPAQGLRILAAEEELARVLLSSLGAAQKAVAITDPVAPADILSRTARRPALAAVPRGIRYAALAGEQRGRLASLVRHYLERAAPELQAHSWGRIERAGLEQLSFAWAGPEARGQGHYYAITGSTLLIEYDNTQNGANHIHSVVRDLANDWDEDLLASHYEQAHGKPTTQAP